MAFLPSRNSSTCALITSMRRLQQSISDDLCVRSTELQIIKPCKYSAIWLYASS